MPPGSAPSPSGARRTPCWARRWGKNVQWGMKAWSRNRRRCDLPMPHWQVGASWFCEKLSPANRNKGYRGEQITRKIVSRELNARSYRDFAKNIALLGATSAKFTKSVGKKMGSNMRPRYIQFRDIHDRDISGLHCTVAFMYDFYLWMCIYVFFISIYFTVYQGTMEEQCNWMVYPV